MVHEVACSPSPSGSASKHIKPGLDANEPDFHTAISYVTRVKVGGGDICVGQRALQHPSQARYEHNRRIYEHFLHVLRAYRDGQISRAVLCEEVNTCGSFDLHTVHASQTTVCPQVAGMFADQHDLLRDFCIFIPDYEQPAVFATACTAQLTGLRVG